MTPNPSPPQSSVISERLNQVRRGIRYYVGAETIALALIWFLLLFWLIVSADYLPIRLGSTEMPRAVRGIALALVIAGLILILIRVGWLRLRHPVADSSAAVLLERKYPKLAGKLITAVELAGKPIPEDAPADLYRGMLAGVIAEAEKETSTLPIAPLFRWGPLLAKGLLAVLLLGATCYSLYAYPSWFSLACQRLFALSETPWPRQTNLKSEGLQLVLPGFSGETAARKQLIQFAENKLSVPRGSSGVLRVAADTSFPVVPEICTVAFRMTDGQRGQTALRRVNGGAEGWQLFLLEGPPVEGMSESMTIDVFGNDFRLRDYRIEVIDPAVIDDMKVECNYPRYLYDEQTGRWGNETLEYRSGLQLPEGTQGILVGSSSSKLSSVEYVIRESDKSADTELVIQRVTVEGNSFRIPLPTCNGNIVIECLPYDDRGLPGAQVQRYQIGTLFDAIPSLNTRLSGIGTEITPNAYLPIRGKITDDHDLSRSWLEFGSVETGKVEQDVPVSTDGEVETTLDLQQLVDEGKLTLPLNSTVGLAITSQDRYDLKPEPHIGLGEPIQLTIVTPEQLLISLEKREIGLRGRLEQVIQEMLELQNLFGKIETSPWEKNELAATDPASSPEEDTADSSPDDPTETTKNDAVQTARRRQTLFIQQASVQTDKSFDEVGGILAEITQIRDELVHNRVDSADRRERLEIRLQEPLKAVIEKSFPQLRQSVNALSRLAPDSADGPAKCRESSQMTASVINELSNVLKNMLDIESYNEIVDMVRAMLQRQEELLERTKSEQKRRVLDLFEP
jgi:molecular chaperone GrpE (heat shock protein)